MVKIRKDFNLNIISLLVAITFVVTSAAYGIDLSNRSNLRLPLMTNNRVQSSASEASEKGPITGNISSGLSRLEKSMYRVMIRFRSGDVKQKNNELIGTVEERSKALREQYEETIRSKLRERGISSDKIKEVIEALDDPRNAFHWFEAWVWEKEKYLLGHESALAVNIIRDLLKREREGSVKDLLEEYILHEVLERTGTDHYDIIVLTNEIFGRKPFARPTETPLGQALRDFINSNVISVTPGEDIKVSTPEPQPLEQKRLWWDIYHWADSQVRAANKLVRQGRLEEARDLYYRALKTPVKGYEDKIILGKPPSEEMEEFLETLKARLDELIVLAGPVLIAPFPIPGDTNKGRLDSLYNYLIGSVIPGLRQKGKELSIVNFGLGEDGSPTTFDLVRMLEESGLSDAIIYGVDNNPEYLRQAKKRAKRESLKEGIRIVFEEGNFELEQTSLRDVDIIIVSNVMLYYPEDTQREALGRMSKVLRNGGIIVVSTGPGAQIGDNIVLSVYLKSDGELKTTNQDYKLVAKRGEGLRRYLRHSLGHLRSERTISLNDLQETTVFFLEEHVRANVGGFKQAVAELNKRNNTVVVIVDSEEKRKDFENFRIDEGLLDLEFYIASREELGLSGFDFEQATVSIIDIPNLPCIPVLPDSHKDLIKAAEIVTKG